MRRFFFLFAALLLRPQPAHAQQPVISGGVPAVAPDGKRIAFLSNRDGDLDVYVIANDGSVARLTRTGENKSAPAWTIDGKRVVFSTFASDTARVFSVNPDGSGQEQIGVALGRAPVLSRDQRHLLVSMGRFPKTELMITRMDGATLLRLTDGNAAVFDAVWSPDGKQIAYTRLDSAQQLGIWVVNADGTGARLLTRGIASEGRPQWPAWSPDGKRLAIQIGRYNRQVPSANISHIWIVDVATGDALKLAPHEEPYLDETPSWFPDGQRIAFQSDRTGRMEIWIMNADGTGLRQVTP